MMFAFVLIAGALAAGAAVLLLLPLMRRREDGRPAAGITAGVVLFLLLLGGGGLYAAFTSYSWVEAPTGTSTPAASAARLAKQLAHKPDNLDGWLELGRRYFDLEQFPLAVRAYQRADRLADGQNVEAISGVAETMLAQDFETIRGAAGRMFERVLEMQPQNPKALLYSALAAMGRGETEVARERFTRMLALNPREDIRLIIEKQLQALDATPSQTDPAAGGGAEVKVRVTLNTDLQFTLTDQSVLYVLARDPKQPGPPFAAKRLAVKLPAEVTLTAADAMLAQRQIAAGQTLEVVARISLNGQPQMASGDPFGQVSYHVGKDGQLTIVIDKQAP